MAGALSALDPSHADAYKANLSAFREKVRARQLEWSGLPTKGRRFVAYHKLFEYLAADFGFTITAYVEPKPGIPPSRRLHRAVDRDDQDLPPRRYLDHAHLWSQGGRFPRRENGCPGHRYSPRRGGNAGRQRLVLLDGPGRGGARK